MDRRDYVPEAWTRDDTLGKVGVLNCTACLIVQSLNAERMDT